MKSIDKQFYTTGDIQKITGFSKQTIYSLINRNEIPCMRIGKKFLIPVKMFEDYVSSAVAGKRA